MCRSFHRGFSLPATILRFGATADANELINPTSVFARWLFLRAAIDCIGWNPDAASKRSLEILQALDDGMDRLVVLAEANGNPEIRQWADARDIARGCLLALESQYAVGETFNLGGAEPFSAEELAAFLSERLEIPVAKACIPNARRPWHISSEKAKRILGYTPQYSVYEMVEDAIQGR